MQSDRESKFMAGLKSLDKAKNTKNLASRKKKCQIYICSRVGRLLLLLAKVIERKPSVIFDQDRSKVVDFAIRALSIINIGATSQVPTGVEEEAQLLKQKRQFLGEAVVFLLSKLIEVSKSSSNLRLDAGSIRSIVKALEDCVLMQTQTKPTLMLQTLKFFQVLCNKREYCFRDGEVHEESGKDSDSAAFHYMLYTKKSASSLIFTTAMKFHSTLTQLSEKLGETLLNVEDKEEAHGWVQAGEAMVRLCCQSAIFLDLYKLKSDALAKVFSIEGIIALQQQLTKIGGVFGLQVENFGDIENYFYKHELGAVKLEEEPETTGNAKKLDLLMDDRVFIDCESKYDPVTRLVDEELFDSPTTEAEQHIWEVFQTTELSGLSLLTGQIDDSWSFDIALDKRRKQQEERREKGKRRKLMEQQLNVDTEAPNFWAADSNLDFRKYHRRTRKDPAERQANQLKALGDLGVYKLGTDKFSSRNMLGMAIENDQNQPQQQPAAANGNALQTPPKPDVPQQPAAPPAKSAAEELDEAKAKCQAKYSQMKKIIKNPAKAGDPRILGTIQDALIEFPTVKEWLEQQVGRPLVE